MGLGDLALNIGGFGPGGAGVAGGCHLGADRAQLGHDLAVHRTDLAALDRHGDGRVAQNGLFDTKTFAIYRHEYFPTPLLPVF